MMYLKIILSVLFLSLTNASENNPSSLTGYMEPFHKVQRLEKVTLKHQIGYHIKRVVREVTKELFVARQIEVEPLIRGVWALNETAENLLIFCNRQPDYQPTKVRYVNVSSTKVTPIEPEFIHLWSVGLLTYSEAKAICQAKGMQLPEAYSENDAGKITAFLKESRIATCFAGIEYDPIAGIPRFTATGIPPWQGYFGSIRKHDEQKYFTWDQVIDDYSSVYFYTSDKNLVFYELKESPAYKGVNLKEKFFSNQGAVVEIRNHVICQRKWNGHGMTKYYNGPHHLKDLKRSHYERVYTKRSIAITESEEDPNCILCRRAPSRLSDEDKTRIRTYNQSLLVTKVPIDKRETVAPPSVKTVCLSMAHQLQETYRGSLRKLEDLLALVDISLHLKDPVIQHGKSKRALPSLAKFFFKTGTKLLWNVFGFYDKLQTDRQIKKNTKQLTKMRTDVDQLKLDVLSHTASLTEVTGTLKSHSILIKELFLATNQLEEQLVDMNLKIKDLESVVIDSQMRIDVTLTLIMIQSVANRITRAVDDSHEMLANIIHNSLMGQTSPLLLPVSQMELVQKELSKLSIVSLLDRDFAKMQSIITSDPDQRDRLLVIINAAAVSYTNLEIVELFPVPYYDQERAYYPILDHKFVALNQPDSKYMTLTAEEAESCLTGRCYISSMEQQVSGRNCGIAQFFDQQLDACEIESALSDGISIQSARPDGVIFSFRSNVTARLFCKENRYYGAATTISGMGVMHVPAGCTLTVSDEAGKIVRLKGSPDQHALDLPGVDLADDNILTIPFETPMRKGQLRKSAMEMSFESQLVIVQNSMTNAYKDVDALHARMWITTGCIVGALLILVVIIVVVYCYSTRFQRKVRKAVGGLANLQEQIKLVTNINERLSLKPPVPPRPPITVSRHSYLRIGERVDDDVRAMVQPSAHSSAVENGYDVPKGARSKSCIYPDIKNEKYFIYNMKGYSSPDLREQIREEFAPVRKNERTTN